LVSLFVVFGFFLLFVFLSPLFDIQMRDFVDSDVYRDFLSPFESLESAAA